MMTLKNNLLQTTFHKWTNKLFWTMKILRQKTKISNKPNNLRMMSKKMLNNKDNKKWMLKEKLNKRLNQAKESKIKRNSPEGPNMSPLPTLMKRNLKA